jgi:dienelactone hydrolase
MKIRRLLRLALIGFLIVAAFVVLLVGTGWAYAHPGMVRTSGVVYGRRLERDLTYDVVKPTSPNGLGVVLVVSGGWKSGTNSFQPWMASPLIRRGYTIFPVFHVSQPQATVAEIFDDVSRAVRHIRAHAREYGIDPARLGVVGGSAGGHLSLMLATRGGPGPANAVDPVDRESSAVQAVAIFYPVTDLLNLGDSTENLHDGGPPKSFVKAFRPDPARPQAWPEIGRALSPIYFVSSNTPLSRRRRHAGPVGPVPALSGASGGVWPDRGTGCSSGRFAWLADHVLGYPGVRGLVRPVFATMNRRAADGRFQKIRSLPRNLRRA